MGLAHILYTVFFGLQQIYMYMDVGIDDLTNDVDIILIETLEHGVKGLNVWANIMCIPCYATNSSSQQRGQGKSTFFYEERITILHLYC